MAQTSRRSLLRLAAAQAAALGVLAACGGTTGTGVVASSTQAPGSTVVSSPSAVSRGALASGATTDTSVASGSSTQTATASALAVSSTSTTASGSSTATAAASTTPATPATSVPAVSPAGTVLEFWNPGSNVGAKKTIDALVATYNQQHPGVTVTNVPTPTDNNYEKYVTGMVSGTGPAALMTFDYSPVVAWAAQGLITPLDAYQAQLGIKEADYFPIVWQMIHFHGHLWGFLQEFDFNLLGWNKRLFQEAGLAAATPPKTTDELDAMAERLTKKASTGALQQVGFCPWISGNTLLWTAVWGGSYYDPATDQWTIVQDNNVKALEWFGKYGKSLGGMAPVQQFTKQVTSPQTPFYAEKLAMATLGEWEVGTNWIPKLAPALQYGVAFPPTAAGVPYGTGQTGGGNVLALPKDSPHATEAAAFLSYMGSPGPVFQWNANPGGYDIPPVQSVAFGDAFVKATPGLGPWLDLLKQDHMVPAPVSPLTPYFLTQLNAARNQVISGQQTAGTALATLAQQMQAQEQQFHATNPNW
jgi:multiple sugar transport system substrate-binding protein